MEKYKVSRTIEDYVESFKEYIRGERPIVHALGNVCMLEVETLIDAEKNGYSHNTRKELIEEIEKIITAKEILLKELRKNNYKID